MNSSDVFRNSSWSNESHVDEILQQAYDAVDYLTISFGILLNLWVLIAVLKCPDLRSRMRNKVVCSFCLLHLLNSSVVLPMVVDFEHKYRQGSSVKCHHRSLIMHMFLMQDFIANWTLVLLMVIFVSQVCDYKPHAGFTKLATVIGTYAVLALPWVGSLITIPVATTSTFDSYLQRKNMTDYEGCILPTLDSVRIIWWLDTTLPLLIAAALLLTAVLLRRRRLMRGHSNDMQVELIDRGPDIDYHYGYTAAVIVTLFCDFAAVFIIFDLFKQSSVERLIYFFISYLMSLTKTVFTPLTWLFFPDIRERLKTWRPWHCPKPGIDLTLVYKNTTQ